MNEYPWLFTHTPQRQYRFAIPLMFEIGWDGLWLCDDGECPGIATDQASSLELSGSPNRSWKRDRVTRIERNANRSCRWGSSHTHTLGERCLFPAASVCLGPFRVRRRASESDPLRRHRRTAQGFWDEEEDPCCDEFQKCLVSREASLFRVPRLGIRPRDRTRPIRTLIGACF